MNTKIIFVLIVVVIASSVTARRSLGGAKKCKAKALCPKVEALETGLRQTQANNEALQKQIDDLANELEELKNPPPTNAPFVCASPWVEFESSCYLFPTEQTNWSDAMTKCDQYGAKPLCLKTQQEQAFVNHHLKGNTWLGVSDAANEGSWVCESDGSAVGYVNWNDGEPNGGTGENLVMLYSNGKWNDISSNYDFHYVCQKQ